ncbi:MAG TPA: hypothetical protein DCY12_12075 [Candidatus Atribacteria bacterium]|nr:hypothetical protein [Candidatus Atribacteria bacterium]
MSKMKKLVVAMVLGLLVSGGATSRIAQVEEKWGPPSKVEKLNSDSIYYWYFYKGRAIAGGGRVVLGQYSEGWVAYEFTVNEEGTIIKKRKYWKQPETEKK